VIFDSFMKYSKTTFFFRKEIDKAHSSSRHLSFPFAVGGFRRKNVVLQNNTTCFTSRKITEVLTSHRHSTSLVHSALNVVNKSAKKGQFVPCPCRLKIKSTFCALDEPLTRVVLLAMESLS